jgi:CSLREA domain-containing protein
MVRLAGALAAVLLFALPDIARADITVNVKTDGDDGVCDATHCTLREALRLAPISEFVHLPAGTYVVNNTPLSATRTATVSGDGARVTTIMYSDDEFISRVLDVQSETELTLSGVRITGGNDHFDEGGGIKVFDDGTLHLSDSVVDGNLADHGGGIYTEGVLDVKRSLIVNNRADGADTGSPVGGGIEIDNIGSAVLENTTVAKNIARNDAGDDGQGGGIYTGANLDLHNVTIAENEAGDGDFGNGGGVFQNFGVSTTLRTLATNTLVARNVGFNCGGTSSHPLQSTNG